jgi:hypothetical protein
MKTIIEFNLPEEKEDHLDALNGSRYKCQIDTLYNEVFRPHLKYDKTLTPNIEQAIEAEVLIKIWEKIAEHFEG